VDGEKVICAGWIGRFGNKCHSYLYGKHIESKFGAKFYVPSTWEGCAIFKNPASVVDTNFKKYSFIYGGGSRNTTEFTKNQKKLELYNNEFNDNIKLIDACDKRTYGHKNCAYISLVSDADWFFREVTAKDIKKYLTFSDELKNTDMFKYHEDAQGTYDVAHFRRTDISKKN
jgi:hypothetical protein